MDRPQISPGPQSTSIHWTKWSTPIFFYNNLRWPRPQPPADQPFWSSTIGTINISTTVDHHHHHHHHHKDKHKIEWFHRPPYPSPASHIEWGLVTVDKKCNILLKCQHQGWWWELTIWLSQCCPSVVPVWHICIVLSSIATSPTQRWEVHYHIMNEVTMPVSIPVSISTGKLSQGNERQGWGWR